MKPSFLSACVKKNQNGYWYWENFFFIFLISFELKFLVMILVCESRKHIVVWKKKTKNRSILAWSWMASLKTATCPSGSCFWKSHPWTSGTTQNSLGSWISPRHTDSESAERDWAHSDTLTFWGALPSVYFELQLLFITFTLPRRHPTLPY